MTITLRSTTHTGATNKGSALTHSELDGNFTHFMDSGGSASVGFIQSGTGAVSRTLQAKERDVINALDFGVVADDATDNATTLQSAATAAIGKKLILPAGTIRSSVAINITGSIQIEGQGRDVTFCKLMNATMNFFNVTSDGAFFCRDMTFVAGQVQSGGAAIRVNGGTPGSTENAKSRFENLTFQSLYQSINFVAANTWVIDGIRSTGAVDAHIVIDNSVNGDSGDNAIVNSYFASGVGIRHNGSGGLRLLGNKFNLTSIGYHCNWTNATSSTQISIIGCQFDLLTSNCILFERTSGSSTIANVVITGNRFSVSGAINAVWFKTNNASFVSAVNLCGNFYNFGASGTGIQIDGGTLFNIAGELMQGNAGTSVGIATGNATATSISISGVQFYSCTTKTSINTASQLAGTQSSDILATNYLTETGTTTCQNATATTVKTFTSTGTGPLQYWIVTADVAQGVDGDSVWAMVAVGNTTITLLTNAPAGATVVFTAAGLNLKVTQGTGVAQNVITRLVRIGP